MKNDERTSTVPKQNLRCNPKPGQSKTLCLSGILLIFWLKSYPNRPKKAEIPVKIRSVSVSILSSDKYLENKRKTNRFVLFKIHD